MNIPAIRPTGETWLSGAIAVGFLAFAIGARSYDREAAMFPSLVAWAGFALALIQVVRSCLPGGLVPAAPSAPDVAGLSSTRKMLIAFVGPAVYAVVLHFAGFWIASILVLLGLPWVLGFGRPIIVAGVALATVASIFLIFVLGFSMKLPAGTLLASIRAASI